MCSLHLVALGAAVGNSMLYFLNAANFAYGGKLVQDQEITFDRVFRYRVL